MEIKVSVIVPTYRRPALLDQCLQALYNQRFNKDSYEVVVVSDGPDEACRQSVEAWKQKSPMNISFIALDEKRGPAAARNEGWKKASGKLIAFTDDDCIPDKGWVAAIWNGYQDEAEVAFTGRIIVPVSGNPTDFERNTQGLETAAFVTANCACSKKALQHIDGFDEAFSMAWREDSDLEFKLLQQHIPVLTLNNAVVIHPVRQAPWGVSLREQKKGMFNALLYKKFPLLYRQRIQTHLAWNYYAIIILFLALVIGVITGSAVVASIAGIGWLGLMVSFIKKRLSNTTHSFNHVMEMIVTSLAIPFLSVFWQLYGAWKYRVLLF